METAPQTITFCYYPNCDHHPSPTSQWPDDPRANHEQLLAFNNATAKARMHDRNPTAWESRLLHDLYEPCETAEDYLTTYTLMETAGLAYFHVAENSRQTSEWRMR